MMVRLWHNHSQDHGLSQVHVSEQLNSCEETQYSGRKKDNKKTTKLDVQLNSTKLTQASAFHNLCRDQREISALPCARSGHFHTICSGVIQKRGCHHRISDCRLSTLGGVFHTDRIDRAAVQTILADLIPAIPHHSHKGSMQSPDLGTFS